LKAGSPSLRDHPPMVSLPPRTPLRITRPGLVVPVRTDPTGRSGPTRSQASGPHWRRTSQGHYVPARVDSTVPEQRIVEAAALLPGFGAVTGWASLRWQGGAWFGGLTGGGRVELPVDLAISSADIRNQPGSRVSAEGLPPHEIVVVDGMRVTTAVRSAFFAMRHAGQLREAVAVLDLAAYSDLVSLDEMAAYAGEHPAWTGVPQVRDALALAEENVWSPAEVSARLIWVLDAHLPSPLCNRPVFDLRGNHLGTPDLFDAAAGVVVEYDGSIHLAGERRVVDVRREEAFRRAGLEYLTVLGDHLRHRDRTAARMREVRRRALAARPAQRRWTIDPPHWWTPTVTVEQRRALTEEQRARWLRHRALAG
jgi:hypothetical protein